MAELVQADAGTGQSGGETGNRLEELERRVAVLLRLDEALATMVAGVAGFRAAMAPLVSSAPAAAEDLEEIGARVDAILGALRELHAFTRGRWAPAEGVQRSVGVE
jgi:hypothetical protein